MNTKHGGSDYERLKAELRRLKRRGAPWYFESELHQRLHGARRRRPRLRPISTTPVLLLAFVTLCLLGLAVYVVLIRSNMIFPVAGEERNAAADTLSRARARESVLVSPGPAPARKGPSGVSVQSPAPSHPPVDSTGRSARARRADTAAVHPDTSSHTIDTAAADSAGERQK
jgi:hypothetical protein